ncbi:DNA-binding protein [Comamonas aquatica]|uniref:DNA-binding protein n=1 Tax=Comamonas aquatica TaxID=225991 RepID=UPI0034D7B252
MALKTRDEVREEFARRGWSITGWARQHGFSPVLVSDILNDDARNPKRKCLRGESHNIAVALKLKDGEISRPSNSSAFSVPTAA